MASADFKTSLVFWQIVVLVSCHTSFRAEKFLGVTTGFHWEVVNLKQQLKQLFQLMCYSCTNITSFT